MKVQTLILNALAPLTSILEGDNRGERLDQEKVINTTKVAVELLGNASAHVKPGLQYDARPCVASWCGAAPNCERENVNALLHDTGQRIATRE